MVRRLGRNAKFAMMDLVSRARRKIIGRHVDALLVHSRNGVFLVDAQDRGVGGMLSSRGEYGSEELQRLRSVLDPTSNLLLVGTHVGSLAIPASKFCGKLTAIEANPKTFQLLEMNLLLNGCSNVRAINLAASERAGTIPFVMSRANSGGSKRLPVNRDYAYFYDSPEIADVPSAPLDEVLDGEQVDVILMDIEGSEYFALKGMQRLLACARVLFMEFVPHHLRNVSGATVSELMSTLQPHFSSVFIPTKKAHVTRDRFVPIFQAMYDNDEVDDLLEFRK